MRTDALTLHSSITPFLASRLLIRGTAVASLGLLCLAYGTLYMPEASLKTWGIPLFFLSLGLIGSGMLPYRRVCRVEKHPHMLMIRADNTIHYAHFGKARVTIPFQAIDRLSYGNDPLFYGIKLWIRTGHPQKITVHDHHFDYTAYTAHCRKKYGCDFFIPFFSKRSFKELEECLGHPL